MRLLTILAFTFCVTFVGSYTLPGADEVAVRSDVQYIKCGVCELLAKNAHRQVKAMRDELKPGKKLSEIAIIERLEKITKPDTEEGEWISKLDLVEQGTDLKVQEHEEVGVCGAECKTIQKAAEEIMGDSDTDLAEILWKGDSARAAVTKWLCREASNACTRKPPPLPKSRKPGPAFKVVDQQELQMQRMMASMQGSGMKGSLFNRDEAMAMVGDKDDDEDEDDDEESDEAASGSAGVLDTLQQKVSDASQNVVEKAKQGLSAAIDAVSKLRPAAKEKADPRAEL